MSKVSSFFSNTANYNFFFFLLLLCEYFAREKERIKSALVTYIVKINQLNQLYGSVVRVKSVSFLSFLVCVCVCVCVWCTSEWWAIVQIAVILFYFFLFISLVQRSHFELYFFEMRMWKEYVDESKLHQILQLRWKIIKFGTLVCLII